MTTRQRRGRTLREGLGAGLVSRKNWRRGTASRDVTDWFFMTYGKQPAANTTLQHVLSLSCGLGMTCVLIAYSSLWWPKITQPSLCTPTSSWFFRGLYVPSTRPFCFTVPIHKRGLRRTYRWSAREDSFDKISLPMKRCELGITTIAFTWIT